MYDIQNQKEKDLINEGSTIIKKLGNISIGTETYYEVKFKKAIQLAEMKEINFDELKNLLFKIEIIYRNKAGGNMSELLQKI